MSGATANTSKLLSHQALLSVSSPELRIYYQECHPPSSAQAKGTILLIHGFPETSYQYRHIIQPLSAAGYHIIVPDYRGHGFSSKPLSNNEDGFTKKLIAADLHTLVHEHIGVKGPIHVMGHDIGGMIAHAYVAQFPKDVKSVIWGECPLPGSTVFDETRHNSTLWHFDFQSHHPDLACALVAGKERMYLKHFYDRLANRAEVFTPEVIDVYEAAYKMPDAFRCGFLSYRAFDLDAADNKAWREKNGKITVKNMVLSGEKSFIKEAALKMAGEFYENPQMGVVEGSGHWCAEENPEGLTEAILDFVGGSDK